jgi:hypothetical protein
VRAVPEAVSGPSAVHARSALVERTTERVLAFEEVRDARDGPPIARGERRIDGNDLVERRWERRADRTAEVTAILR